MMKQVSLARVVSRLIHKTGAFGAHPEHDAHILATLSAIQILTIHDALDKMDVPRVVNCALVTFTFCHDPLNVRQSYHPCRPLQVYSQVINLEKPTPGSRIVPLMHCHCLTASSLPLELLPSTLRTLLDTFDVVGILMGGLAEALIVKVMLLKVRLLAQLDKFVVIGL